MHGLVLVVLAALVGAHPGDDGSRLVAADTAGGQVVFVCEHGTVKSVIAMAWFNEIARRRGLSVRAVSRGLAPDAAVPGAITAGLLRDRLALDGFEPEPLTRADLARALRVIAIGVPAGRIAAVGPGTVTTWDGIPAATEDYAAASAALRARVEQLLE